MENIVAVGIIDDKGKRYFFLTWGRVFHVIDDEELIECVKRFAKKCDLNGNKVKKGYLCWTLTEVSNQPYFFEGFAQFARVKIPIKKGYENWKRKMAREMRAGRQIYFLGNPYGRLSWKKKYAKYLK